MVPTCWGPAGQKHANAARLREGCLLPKLFPNLGRGSLFLPIEKAVVAPVHQPEDVLPGPLGNSLDKKGTTPITKTTHGILVHDQISKRYGSLDFRGSHT